MPTLEALYRQDPESLPFRQPVDPTLLGIPVNPIHLFIGLIFYIYISLNALKMLNKSALHLLKKLILSSIRQFNAAEFKNINESFDC